MADAEANAKLKREKTENSVIGLRRLNHLAQPQTIRAGTIIGHHQVHLQRFIGRRFL